MAVLFDLARQVITTTGSGTTLTLGAAPSGYLTFAQSGVPIGVYVSYGIADIAGAAECGFGQYTASNTFVRNTRESTAGFGVPIALSGSGQIFITALAPDLNPMLHAVHSLYGGI